VQLSNEQILLDLTTEAGQYISGIQDTLNNQTGLLVVLNIQQIGLPPGPSMYATAGGSLGSTTYYARTTYLVNGIEGQPGPEVNLLVAANNVLNIVSPFNFPGVTGYNVYVSSSPGTETKQNNTGPVPIGSTWTEPTTGLLSASSPPAASQGLLLQINGVDLDRGGQVYPLLLSSNPMNVTGRYTFGVGPILWGGVTQGITRSLPDKWQVQVFPVWAADGTPFYYSISYVPF